MAILTKSEIFRLGFKSVGENVYISDKASFYGTRNIELGNNVRIDDFVVISAGEKGIQIGNYIHIGVQSSLIGQEHILLNDFSNISSKVAIYSSNDDYSGQTMSNPMIPNEYKNVYHAGVYIGKHVIIGCGSVILPGSYIGDSSVIGALSIVKVNSSIPDLEIWAGIPVKYIKPRDKNHLLLEEKFMTSNI